MRIKFAQLGYLSCIDYQISGPSQETAALIMQPDTVVAMRTTPECSRDALSSDDMELNIADMWS